MVGYRRRRPVGLVVNWLEESVKGALMCGYWKYAGHSQDTLAREAGDSFQAEKGIDMQAYPLVLGSFRDPSGR
jgi:hypothetical protein